MSDQSADNSSWSPVRGFVRAVELGVLVALLLALLLGVIVWCAPVVVMGWLLRTFVSLLVAWILFAVVQRAAGMAGWACTSLAVVLALLVMLSSHVALAWRAAAAGAWLEPMALAMFGLPTLVGVGACAIVCHRGDTGLSAFADMLSGLMLAGRR